MKKFLSLFALVFFTLALFSCGEKPLGEDPISDPNKPITNGGGIIKFAVESDAPWTLGRSEETKDFIKVTPSKGEKGLTEITVVVEPSTVAFTDDLSFGSTVHCGVSFVALSGGRVLSISLDGVSKYVFANGFVLNTKQSLFNFFLTDTYSIKRPTPITSIDLSRCPDAVFKIGVNYPPYKGPEIENIKDIDISGTKTFGFSSNFYDRNIKNLSVFKANNCTELTSLSLRECEALTIVSFSATQIKTIDLSKNTKLETLEIANNPQLTEVFLKQGQTIKNLKKDPHTVVKYK